MQTKRIFTMRSDARSEALVISPPLAQWAIATLPCDHERSIRTICDSEQCKPAAMHNSLIKTDASARCRE
uniref:Uncharacterized protein n=1 Tax=Anguilla anguilla TaxID=7936 RepID=A0A0E9VB68_ANGAN